ncbi:MAG: hypothetical protein LBG69_01820 [Zoogloeaceae bacterium]|nr:hypothetical protein [Zoogloeaceae bacterium]
MNAPYYIFAYDWQDKSEGVRALHHLCSALNESGEEAWLSFVETVNPKLNTPILQLDVCARHEEEGRHAIAVYPEVVLDNVMDAPVVAHWILNKEGRIAGKHINADPEDLFFYYSPMFFPDETDSRPRDLLNTACRHHDLELFSPDPKRTRTHPLLYINRIPESEIDFSALPPDVEVLSNLLPLPLPELAEKLRGATLLYTYEFSGTCTLAMLCGCPVIAREHPRYPQLGFTADTLRAYPQKQFAYALSDTPEAIAEARARLPGIADNLRADEPRFQAQLTRFIQKTQDAAAALKPPVLRQPSRSKFLRDREHKKECAPLLAQAQAHYAAGENDAAFEKLAQAHQKNPDEPQVLLYLALIAVRARDFGTMQKFILAALRRAPDRHDFLVTLAEELLRTGAAELARNFLNTAIGKSPGLLGAYPLLVEAMRQSGQTAEAKALCRFLLADRLRARSPIRTRIESLEMEM